MIFLLWNGAGFQPCPVVLLLLNHSTKAKPVFRMYSNLYFLAGYFQEDVLIVLFSVILTQMDALNDFYKTLHRLGSGMSDLEKDCRMGAGKVRFKNMGSSSIGCGGQNSLEAESLRPNSPLGEWINDDDDDDDDQTLLNNILFKKNPKSCRIIFNVCV